MTSFYLKRIIGLIAFVSFGVFAQNILSIPNYSELADSTITAVIVIENEDPFVAFQCDIQLNDQVNYVNGTIALSGRETDHNITAQVLTGNILRILSYSLSQDFFTGTSGGVCSFDLLLGGVPGNYPLTLINPIIGDVGGSNILTGSVNGQVTIQSSDIYVTPVDTLDYGDVPLTSTLDRTITINNTGNLPLEIFDINSSDVAFEVLGDTSFIVGSGGSRIVTVRFHSDVKGNYIEDISIESDDSDEAIVEVPLKAVAFAVNELRMQNMLARSGETDTLNLSINNMEEFVGFSFDINVPSVITLASGEFLSSRATDHIVSVATVDVNKIRVICYSSSNSAFTGTDGDVLGIVFNVNGLGGSYPITFDSTVIGDSTAQNIISADYNGQIQVSAPDIAVSHPSIDFGEVSVFDTASVNLTINNVGNDTLRITELTFNDTTCFTNQSVPITILQSDNIVVPIFFHSGVEDVISASLSIRSNDPDEDPLDINLTAESFIPNIMYADSMSVLTTEDGWLDVLIENNEPFVAFQFDLMFPFNISFLDSIKLTSRAVDHALSFTEIDPNTIRVISYSLSQTAYNGTSGPIATVKFGNNSMLGDFPIVVDSVKIGNSLSDNIMSSFLNGKVTVLPQKTHNISLKSSWNLISWSIDTYNDSIQNVLSDIHSNIIIVLGFEGVGTTYDPTLPQFSTLRTMDQLHGYWVKMTNIDSVEIKGANVDIQTPIAMEEGWNLISYLPAEIDSVNHALGSIYDNVEIVLGYDQGGLTHVPGLDIFNTLHRLEPKKGYWVKLISSDTLIFPLDAVD